MIDGKRAENIRAYGVHHNTGVMKIAGTAG